MDDEDKPVWLRKAEELNPVDFIEWMHRNKAYKNKIFKGKKEHKKKDVRKT